MKKQSILLLPVVVAGAVLIAFGQGTPGNNGNSEAVELRNQINALQSRLQALEARMKNLESTVEELKRPHLQPLASPGDKLLWAQPPAAESPPPKIWGEKEINGWKFYLVPCGGESHAGEEPRTTMPSSR